MVADLKIEMTINELIAFAEKIEKSVREDVLKKESEKECVFRISGKDLVGVLQDFDDKSNERKIPETTPEQRAIHPLSY